MTRAIFFDRDLHTWIKFGWVDEGCKSQGLTDGLSVEAWRAAAMSRSPFIAPPLPTYTIFVRAIEAVWNGARPERVYVFVPEDMVPLKPEQVDPLLKRVKALFDPPGA